MERLRTMAQRNMRSARHRNAYHDAQRAYESFQSARSDFRDDAGSDLKALFRRASKRCHPDLVPDPYHDEAVATFQALESAYEAGHTKAVEAIATSLERWGFPREESVTGGAAQEEDVQRLQRAIDSLESSIQEIRGTDAYQDLAEAGDLDALLRAQKEALRRRVRQLRER